MNADGSIDPAHETPEENPSEILHCPEPALPSLPPMISPSETENDPPLFRSWDRSGYVLSPHPPVRAERTPHILHLGILVLIVLFALFCVGLFSHIAAQAHLFGLTSLQQVATNVRFLLAMQAVLYVLTLLISLAVFPLVWNKSLFAGLHWNAHVAFRFRNRLLMAAFVCFVLAMLNGILMPGPNDAPIDKVFRAPGAAWLLFAFGTTFAPFFEEAAFRGFLLPSLCTAFDWIREMSAGRLPLRPCHNGHPRWTIPAMIVASILTSIPFALIHAEQTAYSIGPFLLLVTVSLVLCWVRLSTRSLAASVLVHAAYNLMLFSMMLVGTGGFQHLDKM